MPLTTPSYNHPKLSPPSCMASFWKQLPASAPGPSPNLPEIAALVPSTYLRTVPGSRCFRSRGWAQVGHPQGFQGTPLISSIKDLPKVNHVSNSSAVIVPPPPLDEAGASPIPSGGAGRMAGLPSGNTGASFAQSLPLPEGVVSDTGGENTQARLPKNSRVFTTRFAQIRTNAVRTKFVRYGKKGRYVNTYMEYSQTCRKTDINT